MRTAVEVRLGSADLPYGRTISHQPIHHLYAGACANRPATDDRTDLRHGNLAAAGAGASGGGVIATRDSRISRHVPAADREHGRLRSPARQRNTHRIPNGSWREFPFF